MENTILPRGSSIEYFTRSYVRAAAGGFPRHEGLAFQGFIDGTHVSHYLFLTESLVPEPDVANPWSRHVQAEPEPIALKNRGVRGQRRKKEFNDRRAPSCANETRR